MSLKKIPGFDINGGSPMGTKHSTVRDTLMQKDRVRTHLRVIVGNENVIRKIMHTSRKPME